MRAQHRRLLRAIHQRGHAAPHESGTSLVEFALVLPLLLVLLFAIVDFGRGFQVWITMTNAAREGARAGATGVDVATIQARVIDTTPGLGLTAANVPVTYSPSKAPGNSVVVRVDYTLNLITPLGPLLKLLSAGSTMSNTIALSSTADMRLE